jgi:hypothetical protein
MRLDAGVLEFAPVVDPLPGDTLEGDLVTHRLEARADDGSLAWRQEDRVYEAEPEVGAPSRLPLTFDPEILVEDRPLTLRLHANVLRRSSDVAPGFGGGRGSGLPVEVAAGELLRLSARTAPPSRGSTCDGGPCAFTDGDYRPVPPPGFPPTGVSVTFPTPLTPRWVILRGLAPMRGAVEVVLTGADGGAIYTGRTPSRVFDWPSADGELANQPLDGGYIPDALTLFVAMPIDAGMEASGLRMGDDTAPLYLLGEVSVLE